MKISVSFLVALMTTVCSAQNSSSLLFGYLNKKQLDANSCYRATPTIAKTVDSKQILLQSKDGGTTWEDLTPTLPEGIQVRTGFVKNGEMYLGTFDGKVYYSNNPLNGKWELQQIENNLKLDGSVVGIFQGKSGLYMSIFQKGFYRQTPGTNTWKPIHENLEDKTVHSIVETVDGSILAGTREGIYKSKDDGKTWKQVYKGWIDSFTDFNNIILAGDSKGVIRSTDNGDHWTCIIPDEGAIYKTTVIDDYFVAIRMAGPYRTSPEYDRRVLISKDAGTTWQQMDTGNPADVAISDIAKVGDYLFTSRKAGISRSNDLGKTWELLLSPAVADGMILFDMLVSNSTLFALVKMGGC